MAAASARAAGTGVSEQDYFEELPVVLSVSRLAQPTDEAPGAVTVIDREMIRQSGARQLVDLLRLVPGFQAVQGPNDTGKVTAVYHGLAEAYPAHMQVLIDGRSQYSPFFVGGVNWQLVPVSLDDIERIEVVRGANSAAYGSNAVLGVVNIITRHALDSQGASAEMHAGTQGINDKRLRLGAAGQNVAVRVTAETRHDSGLNNFRDDLGQRLIDGRIDWRLGLRDELQVQFGQIDTTLQKPTTNIPTPIDPTREWTQSQRYLQLGWRRALGEGEDVAVRYYRSDERATDAFTGSFGPFTIPIDYGFRSQRNDLEATHTFRPWAETRLVWGGELRSDAVHAPMWYGRSDDVGLNVARLFGNLEWRPASAWVTNFGATWERDTNSKTTFAPRVAANWHFLPGQTLRAGVTRAYRTPSLFETRGNWAFVSSTGVPIDRMFFAQGNIAPEMLTSHEIGWIGEFKPLRLTGDVRIFNEKLGDRLVMEDALLAPPNCDISAPAPCGKAARIFNAQNVHIRGIEYQFRWQPLEATRLILNQAFVRLSTDYLSPAGVLPGYYYTDNVVQTNNSAPTHATTLMLMQRLRGGLDLSASYQVVGEAKWSANSEAPHWHRLDWRLGYPFRMGATRGEIAFTVQSDGSPHIEHASNRITPRLGEFVTPRGYATLRLDF